MNWKLKLKVLLSLWSRIAATRSTAAPVTLKGFLAQYVFGLNSSAYWPVHFASTISGAQYIRIGEGTAPGLSHGCYIFACEGGEISIGDYTIIAPNVCIAGYNHSVLDYQKSEVKGKVSIGKYSWIGANAVVLPGVVLGDHTVVAAGAVVTRSFPDGYCVIGGNPAQLLKEIPPKDCIEFKNPRPFTGYLSSAEFKQHSSNLLAGKS
ncbi:MAG: acyltransferase [Bacteroidia bacterium]|nr:acyltransferase [Bacteroidia bacterium]